MKTNQEAPPGRTIVPAGPLLAVREAAGNRMKRILERLSGISAAVRIGGRILGESASTDLPR